MEKLISFALAHDVNCSLGRKAVDFFIEIGEDVKATFKDNPLSHPDIGIVISLH